MAEEYLQRFVIVFKNEELRSKINIHKRINQFIKNIMEKQQFTTLLNAIKSNAKTIESNAKAIKQLSDRVDTIINVVNEIHSKQNKQIEVMYLIEKKVDKFNEYSLNRYQLNLNRIDSPNERVEALESN
ncbi:MAG: hypothetical protein OXE77_11475 [Flavobacteriaceae bacterium]|nr:hypothetical protein [Flavobacteriaceae bacterium]